MENKIYSSIMGVMNDIEAIEKNKKNAQQGYSFRGIDDMYNAIHPLFAKHKIFITSKVLNFQREERQTKSGGSMFTTLMDVEFTFYAEDGSHVSSIMRGEAMDSGDKGSNKAQSAALKYALMQMLLIPTEDMDDADSVTPPDVISQKPQVKPQPKEPVVDEFSWMSDTTKNYFKTRGWKRGEIRKLCQEHNNNHEEIESLVLHFIEEEEKAS